jgi:hypothetical protein
LGTVVRLTVFASRHDKTPASLASDVDRTAGDTSTLAWHRFCRTQSIDAARPSRIDPDWIVNHALEGSEMAGPRTALSLALAVTALGCSAPLTTREKGALAGGAIGAGTGAVIGSQVGHTGGGALIGAGIGAVSGAIIGDAIQGAEERRAVQAPPPAPSSPPRAAVVAVAPPPPIVAPQPHYVWVPEWGIYVMEGYDIVYYGGAHYYYYGSRWYISQSYAGPWAFVASPPPAFGALPPGQFNRSLPPGLAKKGKIPPGHMR